ncbi:hypothetical protein WJX75_005580 [Coccomyxa subellipsoidea]|uniref:Galactose oxidase n=1 Tax=Coccomyxa subellipsoidea TaxID=248742 RepID=A0ABR2Z362_9CHLO
MTNSSASLAGRRVVLLVFILCIVHVTCQNKVLGALAGTFRNATQMIRGVLAPVKEEVGTTIIGARAKVRNDAALVSSVVACERGSAASGQYTECLPNCEGDGNWTLTGPLPEPFVGNYIIPLPGVGALIAGGGNSAISNATAIFHQLERKWTPTGELNQARAYHKLAKVGVHIMAIGGFVTETGTSLKSTEIYNPLTAGPDLLFPRDTFQTAVSAGRVLVIGGYSDFTAVPTVEIWSPLRQSWAPAAPLNGSRTNFAAVSLSGGCVLAIGGFNEDLDALATVEEWDPVRESWSFTAPLTNARALHGAVALTDGSVLVCGGGAYDENADRIIHGSCELWDPTTGLWSPTGTMHHKRASFGMLLLPNGKVIAVSGTGGDEKSAEIYDPDTKEWMLTRHGQPGQQCCTVG